MSFIQSTLAKYLGQVVFWSGNEPKIAFDASLSETHKQESVPTEFEVEDGQYISDHMVLKPFSLKIQAVISNTPLASSTNAFGGAAAAVSTIATIKAPDQTILKKSAAAFAALPLIPGLTGFAKNAYQTLLTMQSARTPFRVSTSLQVYENMWFKSISVPRDSKSAGGIIVDIDLVQLLLVTPDFTTVSNTATPNNSSGETNKGNQNAETNPNGAADGFNNEQKIFGVK